MLHLAHLQSGWDDDWLGPVFLRETFPVSKSERSQIIWAASKVASIKSWEKVVFKSLHRGLFFLVQQLGLFLLFNTRPCLLNQRPQLPRHRRHYGIASPAGRPKTKPLSTLLPAPPSSSQAPEPCITSLIRDGPKPCHRRKRRKVKRSGAATKKRPRSNPSPAQVSKMKKLVRDRLYI